MTRTSWGYAYWGAGWLLLGFLLSELLGYYRVAPWPTFSETVWSAIKVDPGLIGPLVFATLVFLTVHFLYHREVWKSVLFGIVVALVAHWMDKRL